MASILVIEDDPGVRDLLTRVLVREGHEIETACDGREGMQALGDFEADIVITDINMPGMDGIELITNFRKTRVDVPIIAISGGGLIAKEVLLSSAAALGAVEVVSKPFELGQLVGAVGRALAGEDNRAPVEGIL